MRVIDFGAEAHGVIAIGGVATGFVAIGQLATGVVAIGQLSRGIIAVGQLAIGLVAIGQVGIGVGYGAGMLGLGTIAGGMLPLPVYGRLPLSRLFGGQWRIDRVAFHLGRAIVWVLLALAFYFIALEPLLSELPAEPPPRR